MTAPNKKVMDAIGATIKPRRSVEERAIQTARVLSDQTALTSYSEEDLQRARAAVETTQKHAVYETVDINLIDDNPYNSREKYKQEKINERAKSIAASGQVTPAAVATHPDVPGRYILIDGQYRKRALQLLGRKQIDIKKFKINSQIELYLLSKLHNQERENECVLDHAYAWQRLMKSGLIKEQHELCTLEGKSEATVSKTLSLLKIPAQILDMFDEQPDRLTLRAGGELLKLCELLPIEEVVPIAREVLLDEISVRELENLVRTKKTPRNRKEMALTYKLTKSEIVDGGYIKNFGNGKILVELRINDAAAREKAVTTLREMYQSQQNIARTPSL